MKISHKAIQTRHRKPELPPPFFRRGDGYIYHYDAPNSPFTGSMDEIHLVAEQREARQEYTSGVMVKALPITSKPSENDVEHALEKVIAAGLGTVLENQGQFFERLEAVETLLRMVSDNIIDTGLHSDIVEMLGDRARIYVNAKDKKLVKTRTQKLSSMVAEELKNRTSASRVLDALGDKIEDKES